MDICASNTLSHAAKESLQQSVSFKMTIVVI